jgi:hypothetical protein
MDLVVEIKVVGIVPMDLYNKLVTSVKGNVNLISCKGEEIFVEGLDVTVNELD